MNEDSKKDIGREAKKDDARNLVHIFLALGIILSPITFFVFFSITNITSSEVAYVFAGFILLAFLISIVFAFLDKKWVLAIFLLALLLFLPIAGCAYVFE